MNYIGYQDGIEAARLNWNKLDPGKKWPDKLASTLDVLKDNSNESIKRFADLEKRLDSIPFPYRAP